MSHQIMNKLDEIKEKLTDNEYKEIAELLQAQYRCDESLYDVCMIIPKLVYSKCSCQGECCGAEPEVNITTKFLTIQVKLKNIFVAGIQDDVKENTIKFTADYTGQSITFHRGWHKYKELWSAMEKQKMFCEYLTMFLNSRLEVVKDHHHLTGGNTLITILSITRFD